MIEGVFDWSNHSSGLLESFGFCAVSTQMALFWFAPVRLTRSPDEAGPVSDGGPSWLFPERFFVFQDAA